MGGPDRAIRFAARSLGSRVAARRLNHGLCRNIFWPCCSPRVFKNMQRLCTFQISPGSRPDHLPKRKL
eukprot:8883544-Alexandrium_andersonii.AAC.1